MPATENNRGGLRPQGRDDVPVEWVPVGLLPPNLHSPRRRPHCQLANPRICGRTSRGPQTAAASLIAATQSDVRR